MTVLVWLRLKLFGHPDSAKPAVVEKINREVSKLNGATERLTEEVRAIETDRDKSKRAFSQMLDETLQAMNREHRK